MYTPCTSVAKKLVAFCIYHQFSLDRYLNNICLVKIYGQPLDTYHNPTPTESYLNCRHLDYVDTLNLNVHVNILEFHCYCGADIFISDTLWSVY